MEEDPEEALLERIKPSFAPHPPTSSNKISFAKSADLRTTNRNDNAQSVNLTKAKGPKQTVGVYDQYLEAVRDHDAAERDFKDAIAQIQSPEASHQHALTDQEILLSHLRLRRSQQEHDQLRLLDSYRRELDQLTLGGISPDKPADTHRAGTGTSTLKGEPEVDVAAIKILLSNLEIAVIQADRDCRVEKGRLEETRNFVMNDDSCNHSDELKALDVVREELTRWLEESLALCTDDELAEIQKAPRSEQSRLSASDVQEAYGQYVGVRQRVIQAAQTTSAVASEFQTTSSGISAPLSAESVTDELFESRQRLSLSDTSVLLSRMTRFAEDQIREEHNSTSDQLQRLVDESQLLSAFPILARTDGNKREISTNTSDTSTDTISKQVEAWKFAARAAGDSSDQASSVHTRAGRKAMERVKENIEDLRKLSDLANP